MADYDQLEVPGFSGVRCHVVEHFGGVGAFCVQGRVGIVFGDAPDAVLFVPEGGPPWVLLEEAGDLRGSAGCGEAGHEFLPCSRLRSASSVDGVDTVI